MMSLLSWWCKSHHHDQSQATSKTIRVREVLCVPDNGYAVKAPMREVFQILRESFI